VGVASDVPATKIVTSLLLTVVVPLVAGQGVRIAAWERIRPLNIPFGKMASAVLLLIIYSAFCDTFAGHDVTISRETVVSALSYAAILQQ
jgi:predicted Na+-dependent transporter